MSAIGRRLAFLGALLLLRPAAARAQASAVSLKAGAEPGSYRVEGGFAVAASPELAWEVLTDYDAMPDFVSSLRRSRLLHRDLRGALIEQEGTGRLLFVSKTVKLMLSVKEKRPSLISFEDVDGLQFKRYEGSWRIEPTESGCLVAYELDAQPDPSLAPEFATTLVLRRSARRLLEEVRAEIDRRARLAKS